VKWCRNPRAKDPEGWGATDKFTVVLESCRLDATELSAYCRERVFVIRAKHQIEPPGCGCAGIQSCPHAAAGSRLETPRRGLFEA